MKKQKIALFHPWIKSKGGAEKVVLEILEKSKHDFEVYTWAYDAKNTFEGFNNFNVNILTPKCFKKLAKMHILRGLFLLASLFSKIPLEKYDAFIISTSGVGEFITFRNYKKNKTYAYIHTPLREANKNIIKWNLENRYQKSFIKKYIYLISVKIYKFLEKLSWRRLDYIIFNSELSKSRAEENKLIKNKKTKIVYPPIEFSRFKKLKLKKGKYFLYWSRLNPPKRQDLLLEAWKKFSKHYPKYKLIIAGNVDNKRYYEKLNSLKKELPNVEIKVNVSNSEIDKLLSNSLACFFLGYLEDFGISPLESISSGKPLLAVDQGGFVKLIKNNPQFYKIKEKHKKDKMINEIYNTLCNFIKKSKGKIDKKIKIEYNTNNFINQIDKIVSQ